LLPTSRLLLFLRLRGIYKPHWRDVFLVLIERFLGVIKGFVREGLDFNLVVVVERAYESRRGLCSLAGTSELRE
jgi:hypothetical protein